MNFIGRKDILDGEVIIYNPKMHWVVLLRPSLLFGVFFMLLLVKLLLGISGGYGDILFVLDSYLIPVLVINAVCVGVYLIWQVFEFFAVEYYITNKRLILKKGLFSTVLIDMPVDKIESVFSSQNFWGKVFGYGTVYVSGIGGMLPRYAVIHKPYSTRRIINRIIENNKRITIVRNLPKKPAEQKPPKPPKPEIAYGTYVIFPSAKKGS